MTFQSLVKALVVTALFSLVTASPTQQPAGTTGYHWVDTWTAMPQLTEFANLPSPPFNQTNSVFFNSTIRQTIHTSIGGKTIRLRISNAFGLNDLPITAVTIALPLNGTAGVSAIVPNTVKRLTFSGNQSITIPNAGLAVSDPIDFTIGAQSNLAVTIYLANGQASNFITSHPGSRVTSWYTFGDQVNAANITGPNVQNVAHWFFISALEVWAPSSSSAFAIVGDSITDGRASDNNENDRWPDNLLKRMQVNKGTTNIGVLNQAAGGNRVLEDGLGPAALGRIDRDVLSHSGIKYAMIFEGVNDIGTANLTVANLTFTTNRLIQAYKQISTRIHVRGIPFFGATITPFGAPNSTIQPYSSPLRETYRQEVNTFIRNSGGVFDAVVDFDEILRDPKNHTQLNPLFNSGDYLHPNEAGYQLVASEFPLNLFSEFSGGVSGFV
ncbi:hypothetical protein FRB93_012241 [Tulasnella sp. JGI-2019a]|nr:hypothetical protein FRB93_012241 [Tulasnella sp. JGI-2019a]